MSDRDPRVEAVVLIVREAMDDASGETWPPRLVEHYAQRIVEALAAADAVEPSRHGRIVTRLMTFGGFQRTERGEFWVSRDDVLRLLEEELGADAVEGHRDQGTCRCGEPFGAHDSRNGACPFWLSTYAP